MTMKTPHYPIGVLIMAYGGPDSPEELPGYLADIREGRPTPKAIVDEITHNYTQIGGRSPLLVISQRQTSAIAAQLDPALFRCYLGMRHWSPWLEDVVGRMAEDGVTHAVSLALAPHFSKLSIAKYQAKIADGLAMYHGQIEFRHIASYHDAPGLIQTFAARVSEGLNRWPPAERERVHVVFSAHSLPVRIVRTGDPYASQLMETAQLVADAASLARDRWSWSYQSAGRSPEPWLGPQLPEHLRALALQGVRNVISLPVGFVSDHVEILYDIDIQAQVVADELGMRLERPPSLNDDPLFIAALVDLVKRETAAWLPQATADDA